MANLINELMSMLTNRYKDDLDCPHCGCTHQTHEYSDGEVVFCDWGSDVQGGHYFLVMRSVEGNFSAKKFYPAVAA